MASLSFSGQLEERGFPYMTSADRGDDQDFSKFADIQYKEDEGVKIPKFSGRHIWKIPNGES